MLIHGWRTIKSLSEDSRVSGVKPDHLKASSIVLGIELNKYALCSLIKLIKVSLKAR